MPIRGRRRWLVLVALCAMCSACTEIPDRTYPKSYSASAILPLAGGSIAEAGAPPMQGVTGHWEGVSSADCIGVTIANPGRCHAEQNITLTMLQQGDAITGFYTCAYGNQICPNLDETGVIRNGHMTGRRLMMRVMLGDGSMCFFTAIPQGSVIEGRYSCLQGGGIIERGAFRTVRSY